MDSPVPDGAPRPESGARETTIAVLCCPPLCPVAGTPGGPGAPNAGRVAGGRAGLRAGGGVAAGARPRVSSPFDPVA